MRSPVVPNSIAAIAAGEDGERDIVTTPSGLSYADVRVGGGDPENGKET